MRAFASHSSTFTPALLEVAREIIQRPHRVDIGHRHLPEPRIMMRSVRKTRDLSILVLLDLSESTNEKVQDQEYSVRELTQ